MEENQVSRTALSVAYARAYHSIHGAPKIFDDFLAYHLITDRIRLIIEQSMVELLHSYDPERAASCPDQATALEWEMQGSGSIISRARYTEDNLLKAVRQDVRQYVILGAGMDTFAFRHPEMLEQLQVFEVDHPATQGFKRNRIAQLGWELPKNLHFIPVDFTKESLTSVLTRSSYDSKTPSFFSWLGVTYYLTRDDVFSTLRNIASVAPPGSMVIFDYLDTDAFVPERASKRLQLTMKTYAKVGEPVITGFDPPTLAADLERIGLRLHENLNPTDIEERHFKGRTDRYHAGEHVHYAWAVFV